MPDDTQIECVRFWSVTSILDGTTLWSRSFSCGALEPTILIDMQEAAVAENAMTLEEVAASVWRLTSISMPSYPVQSGKFSSAVRIRDISLALLTNKGAEWHEEGDMDFRSVSTEELRIVHQKLRHADLNVCNNFIKISMIDETSFSDNFLLDCCWNDDASSGINIKEMLFGDWIDRLCQLKPVIAK